MLRVLLILLMVTTASAVRAAERRFDPTPFSHAPCSVLDNEPCTPSICSIFGPWPCVPELDYPLGENLQVTVQTVHPESDAAKYSKPDHDLDDIGDLFAALRACWSPPPAEAARQDMQMAVRFSFKRNGEWIGPPRLTFATPGVPSQTRTTYLDAINNSLKACLPLKFTPGFGGAIAGRPIAIRYVDNRDLKTTSSDRK